MKHSEKPPLELVVSCDRALRNDKVQVQLIEIRGSKIMIESACMNAHLGLRTLSPFHVDMAP